MTIRTSILMGGMAAAIALTAVTGANADTLPLYGGGSTLVEKVYRDLFNTYGNTAGTDLCFGLTTACPSTHYNDAVEILYVGVGSGNGLKALEFNDANQYVSGGKTPDKVPVPSTKDFGPFYGTGTGSTWVPGTGVGPAFPSVTFSGSDNTLSQTDLDNAKNAPIPPGLGNNPLIQIPGIIAAIAVPFNPAANWTPGGASVLGASSKVQLSTNTLCGIFTGKITTWNNANITKDNGGKRLGTGTITVVYRNDSSGTTFIFTNALINQCGNTANAAGGITAVKTKSTFPVPGQWLADNTLTYNASAPHYKSGTSFFINVFNKNHLPANFYNDQASSGVVGGASGSGGIKKAILATQGSIGYVSPDFVLPVDKTGPAAANLQTYATFSAGTTPVYRAPTAGNASPILATTKPPSFGDGSAKNPLAWGVVNPTPSAASAYPIGGFSFIDLHRCYASADVVAALVGAAGGGAKAGYLTWYYGPSSVNQNQPASILAKDGFAPVPAAWKTAINKLLTNPTLGVNVVGSGGCKGIAHGA